MKQLLIIIILFTSISSNATTYYVSNSGDDSNSGTTEVLPWKTIDKVNSFTFSSGDNILFKRGDTFYGTLRIGQSGSTGNPITFGAYGFGDNPIITGLESVTSWTDLGFNIWKSASAVSDLDYSNIVVINGINAIMGRYPNTGYLTYQSHSGTTSITSSSLTGTPDWTGAELVSKKNRWIMDRNVITNQSTGTLTFTSGSYIALTNSLNYTPTNGFGFFIQNDTRTLDTLNEWFYNSSDKTLSVYSESEPTDVKIATLDTLISLEIYSHDYTFKNLTFTGCNDAVININSVSNLTLDSCTFQFNYDVTNESNWGENSDNLIIQNCTFLDISNSAIKKSTEATNSKILNNTFKRIAIIPGAGGSGDGSYVVTSLFGEGTQVKYNNVDSVAYNGIDFNTDNINVSYNTVSNYCLLKDDGAGIYSIEPHVGDTVAYNTIFNGGVPNAAGTDGRNHAFGIYLDDYSSGFYVHHNNISNPGYAGIYAHNAKDSKIESNNIYNPIGYYGLFVSTKATDQTTTGITFKNNTAMVGKSMRAVGLESWQNDIPSFGEIDSNYYAIQSNSDSLFQASWVGNFDNYYNLSGWQSYSDYDIHSTATSNVDSSKVVFEYNETGEEKDISLDGVYADLYGNSYSGSITLQPYTSITLIKTGDIIPPPVVNAGADQYINLGDTVSLNGSVESAPGHTSTYLWTFESGSGVFSDATVLNPTVTDIALGENILRLTATQDDDQEGHDDMKIIVSNPPSTNLWILKNKVIFINSD